MSFKATDYLSSGSAADAVPVHGLFPDDAEVFLASHPARPWLAATGFKAEAGAVALLPGENGALSGVLAVLPPDAAACPFAAARIAEALPAGRYHWPDASETVALGWALAHYRFDRYTTQKGGTARMLAGLSPSTLTAAVRTAEAIAFVRDLINIPAADLGPDALAATARELAAAHNAHCAITKGDALAAGFPMIAAVGRAGAEPPCLIDIVWGDPAHPKLTLIGKGICFDSGGLDIKPASGMKLMKKDMGGAAHALGLGRMIMEADLPVRLRILIPAAENGIAAGAYRPGDILKSRKNLSVEITNTDAEGRLVLADALALADEETPDLLFCFATLTGAARVALGPDLPAFFTPSDTLAAAVEASAREKADPLWRLPLWAPYADELKSPVADLANASDSGFAGAVTAALFLQRFISNTREWGHFDLYAWTPKARPGRPQGGDAFVLRALFDTVAKRFLEKAGK